VRLPAAPSVKVTAMLQLVLAARAELHLFEGAKSEAFVPLKPMLATLRDGEPLLVRITVCALLAVSTASALNDTEVELGKAIVAVTAVPVSETVCGEVGAASPNCSVAVRVPATVGVKLTETLQLHRPPRKCRSWW
jgi:hypothetical protein